MPRPCPAGQRSQALAWSSLRRRPGFAGRHRDMIAAAWGDRRGRSCFDAFGRVGAAGRRGGWGVDRTAHERQRA